MKSPAVLRSTVLALAAVSVAAGQLAAQSFRTVTASRVMRGEKALTVNVEFGVGQFRLAAHPGTALYQAEITYDEDRFTPVTDFDTGDEHTLHVGIEGRGRGEIEYKGRGPRQRLELTLSPAVPMELDLRFGAVLADIDLGGLSLTEASIKTGASQSRVYFSRPNRVQCRELSIGAGAAEFTAAQLGNARCERITFEGAAGDITLDFTGEWPAQSEVEAAVKLGFGSLTLRLPRDIGVAVNVTRFLASFDQSGFVKDGNTYFSQGFDESPARLRLEIDAAIGDIQVQWVDARRGVR